jgi:hypothetical protein
MVMLEVVRSAMSGPVVGGEPETTGEHRMPLVGQMLHTLRHELWAPCTGLRTGVQAT